MPRYQQMRAVLPLLVVALVGACENANTPAEPRFSEVARNGDYVQIDRFGRPAIATVFIPTNERDQFNLAVPANDRADFTGELVAKLTAFGYPDPAGLAAVLLPDIQGIDLSQPTTFLNGRRLQDDVITAELGIIFGTNVALNDDHVDANDKLFLSAFPYLAEPHIS